MQQGPIHNNVTANASGASGAEVAAGARQGANRATDRAVRALRETGIAIPRVEPATQ